jgi:hypothetical protein
MLHRRRRTSRRSLRFRSAFAVFSPLRSLIHLRLSLTGLPLAAKTRSANEIVPHFLWLLNHGPDDDIKCSCKYCSKTKLQRDVNQKVGLVERASSVAPSSGSPAPKSSIKKAEPAKREVKPGEKEKKRRQSGDGFGASTKKQRISTGSPPPSYQGPYVSRHRDSDLSDLFTHRFDDLVYAELPTPLLSDDPSNPSKITHWPGIVVGRRVASSTTVDVPPVLGDPKPPKLTTTQAFRYDVRLLAVRDELTNLRQDQLRAWLAHPPPNAWEHENLVSERAMKHIWNGKHTLRDCSVVEDLEYLEDAFTALGLALQIAAHLVGSYVLKCV